MTLNTFVTQGWRILRLGAVAAVAQTQAATHVASGDHKALVVAGAVAAVEAIYRAAVPAKEQSTLASLYRNFVLFLESQKHADQAGHPGPGTVATTPVVTDDLTTPPVA